MEGKKEMTPMDGVASLATTVVLVGAMCKGKPNFMTIAWCSPASMNPPSLLVVCNKSHVTNEGIREAKAFSVSVIGPENVAAADFVGMKSAREVDKSNVFKTVTGKHTGAPLIVDCPLTMELSLAHTFDTGTHDLFIGAIKSIFADTRAVAGDGKLDPAKLNATLFSFAGPAPRYYNLGAGIGQCWQVGATYKPAASAAAAAAPAAAPAAAVEPFPHVDASACVGCGTCVGVCPHEMFEMGADGVAKFKEEKLDDCVRCEECVHNCAASAISMKPK